MKRATIVGASTAMGKELAEVLNNSTAAAWDVSLVDAGAAGQITSAGDEAFVVGALETTTFDGADVVFFAGDAESTRTSWQRAVAANAALVDTTGVLTAEAKTLLYAPGVSRITPDLNTVAMAPVQATTWVLASLLRCAGGRSVVATVLNPASQFGDAAVDELHRQTVALLSFQTQPQEIFDGQVAFALRDTLGSAAQTSLEQQRLVVDRELRELDAAVKGLSYQLIQAPVFHGTTASAWMDLDTSGSDSLSQLISALEGVGFEAHADGGNGGDAEVSNISATSRDAPLARVRSDGAGTWVWLAVDNVRWIAQAAEACGLELLALRPTTPVQ